MLQASEGQNLMWLSTILDGATAVLRSRFFAEGY